MAPTRDGSVTLKDGTRLTLKEVEAMFATFKHSGREVKDWVDWTAVSQDIGYSNARSARDRMSHMAQKFGWFRTAIVPKHRVAKK
ncbi:hypothetical protein K449DRAFT_431814 [Hypoxylon sp. EC38]|nr:hypothetical protein K449DRAFT_431814 [Hypoxylon sp. EC38]